ncbi:MAG: carbohydrate-binding protein, partial [Elusimicrobia bacterium]|nr:carbohydrate-binding protein [Elusimicrobiota bacterium]
MRNIKNKITNNLIIILFATLMVVSAHGASINVDYSQSQGNLQRMQGYTATNRDTGPLAAQRLKDIDMKLVRVYYMLNKICPVTEGYYDWNSNQYGFYGNDNNIDNTLLSGAQPIVTLWYIADANGKFPTWLTTETDTSGQFFSFPPKNYSKWERVIRDVLTHLKTRYPQIVYVSLMEETESYKGDYNLLYQHTINAVNAVNTTLPPGVPAIKLGGPGYGFAGNISSILPFIQFVKDHGLKLDFLGFNDYSKEDTNRTARDIAQIKTWLDENGLNPEIIVSEWCYTGADIVGNFSANQLSKDASWNIAGWSDMMQTGISVKPIQFANMGYAQASQSITAPDLFYANDADVAVRHVSNTNIPDGYVFPKYNISKMLKMSKNTYVPVTTVPGSYLYPIASKDSSGVALLLSNYQATGQNVTINLSNLPSNFLSGNIHYQRYLVDNTHNNYGYGDHSDHLLNDNEVLEDNPNVPSGTSYTNTFNMGPYATTLVVLTPSGATPYVDNTPPSTIGDLAVTNNSIVSSIGSSSIVLSWTAPNPNDVNNTTVSEYDIRCSSTGIINDGNWKNVHCADGPAPKAAGLNQTYTVQGLVPDTNYYFAIKSSDTAGNCSIISNITPVVKTAALTTNLASGKIPTAYTAEIGYETSKAVDGDVATYWKAGSSSDLQWLCLDLGSTYNITEVVLRWYEMDLYTTYAKSYQIQVSNTNNGTDWQTIYTKTDGADYVSTNGLFTLGTGGTDDIILSGSGRYVRMYEITKSGTYPLGLCEFGIYGNSNTPTITVTYPNGGESLTVGSQQTVTWTSAGTVGNVNIDISTDGGATWSPLVSNTANDGSELVNIPNTPSTTCRIRVQEPDGSPTDTSNSNFTITSTPPPPTITVTYPNGGESLTVGSQQTVTWTNGGTVGNVNIDISTDGGATWSTLVSNTANNGSQSVTVPNTPSTSCRIRVQEPDGSPTDTSNSNFTITSTPPPPTITVTYPNGGESLTVGSQPTVTWTSGGTVGNVNIAISTNSGTSWVTYVTNTANDGSQPVTIPNTPSTACRIMVQELDGSPTDMSDSNFTITTIPPVVSISTIAITNGSNPPATITIKVNATDSDGIKQVDFYSNGNPLLPAVTTPDGNSQYVYTWNNVSSGTYSITAKATDNSNATTTTTAQVVVISGGNTQSATQQAYPAGVAWLIGTGTTTIEAEAYDMLTSGSGEGVAYHDTTPGQEDHTNLFRATEDVDIESCSDAGAGYDIGYTIPGEWLEYSINVNQSGTYKIILRTARDTTVDDMVHLEFAQNNVKYLVTPSVSIPGTGGWQVWTDTEVATNVTLNAGNQIMKLVLDPSAASYCSNINHIKLVKANADTPNTVETPTISPGVGTYASSVTVTLGCATIGAAIRYTTNGTDPTSSSTLYSAPFTLTASATVKARAFKAAMTDSSVNSVAYTITNISTQQSYGNSGNPWQVGVGTTTIETENYDTVTSGSADGKTYYDTTPGNSSGAYRTTESVDIENCTDTGGGYDIGYVAPTEWLEYSVNVSETAEYQIIIRGAMVGPASPFHIEFGPHNGTAYLVTPSVTVPDTGGWQTWQDVEVSSRVTLIAGNQIMKIVMEGTTYANGNFNYVRFRRLGADTTPPIVSVVIPTSISGTAAVITWTTNEPATSKVEYGLTTSYGNTTAVTDNSGVTSHSVTLSGLTENTVYHYRMVSVDMNGNPTTTGDYSFTTILNDPNPPVISNITASVTQNSAIITWNTDENSDSQVTYGTSTAMGTTTTLDSAMNRLHSVPLSGLLKGNTYYYMVYSRDSSGNLATSIQYSFKTYNNNIKHRIYTYYYDDGTTTTKVGASASASLKFKVQVYNVDANSLATDYTGTLTLTTKKTNGDSLDTVDETLTAADAGEKEVTV